MREEILHSQLLVKGGSAHPIVHLFAQLMEIQVAQNAYYQISTYGPLLKGDDLKQLMHVHDANGVQVQHQLPEDKANYNIAQIEGRNKSNMIEIKLGHGFMTLYPQLVSSHKGRLPSENLTLTILQGVF